MAKPDPPPKQGGARKIAPPKRKPKGKGSWVSANQLGLLAAIVAVCWTQYTFFDATPIMDMLAPRPAPLTCSGDTEQQFVKLQQELAVGGADVSKLSLGSFNGLRGLQTTVPVAEGEAILSIPLSWTISAASFNGWKKIGKATQRWHGIEDADMLLDALALLYERYVMQSNSRWATYMCILPQQYSLPVNYTTARAKALLGGLPELQRLVTKRQTSFQAMLPLMRHALALFPGGRRALKNMSAADFEAAALWAYSATKTRTVSLELDKAKEYVKLPKEMQTWVKEMGALVPLLDMANYAGGTAASANFAVRLRKLERGKATSEALLFSLLATRDLEAGEEVTFTYLPEDDEEPRCTERWLLEYGFPLDDGRPERGCYTWNVTVHQVASMQLLIATHTAGERESALKSIAALAAGKPPGDTLVARELLRLRDAVESRLVRAGLPLAIQGHVTRDGQIRLRLGQWLIAAIGGDDQSTGEFWATMMSHMHGELSSLLQWSQTPAAQLGSTGDAPNNAVGTDGRDFAGWVGDAGGMADEDEASGLLPVIQGALAALKASLEAVGGRL